MTSDTNSSHGFNESSGHDNNSMHRAEYNAEMRDAFIPVMVLTGIESVIGIIGNSLVFYVFSRRYKKCNFKLFVLFLCATDLAGCIVFMTFDIAMRYYYFDVPGQVFCKIRFFLMLSILLAESFLFLVICIDRYRKICHPLSWQISYRTALRLIISALFIVTISAGLVAGIVTGSHDEEVTYRKMNIILRQCGSDQKYNDTPVPSITVIVELTSIVGILLVMIVLYFLVAKQLYNSKAAFNSETKTNKSQRFFKANYASARRKSIIAITLTVVFIVTVTLHGVFLYLLATHQLKNLSKGKWAAYNLIYTTYMVNYCINPIIYGCLDYQFSKFLRDLINRVCGSRTDYAVGDADTAGK